MSRQKILIIDYEPRSIQKLRAPLEKAGYHVDVAQDGIAGIAAFKTIKPDLTLIEAMLPKKHGFEVCQELKQTPHGKATPILIVTSVYKGRKYRTQALHQYGCNEYLEKPLTDEQLLETIGGFLKPTAAPVTAAAITDDHSSVSDITEREILDRLDEILPGNAATDQIIVADEAMVGDGGKADKVVEFDPDRSRKRRKGSAQPGAPATSRGTSGSLAAQGAAKPASLDPIAVGEPAQRRRAVAQTRAETAPVRDSRPSVNPKLADAKTGKRMLWLGLVLLLVVLGAAAFVLLTA